MKKYLLAFVAFLLAFPAVAETLPQNVYKALVLQGLHLSGQTLSEQQQEQLKQYQPELKGVIIIKVGFKGCSPCFALEKALLQEGFISLWKEKGFSFYELSSIDDKKRPAPNFCSVWRFEGAPTMYFFKDGQLQSFLEGFDVAKQDETVEQLRDWTNSVR